MQAGYNNQDLINYRIYSENRSFSMLKYQCDEDTEIKPHWHNSIEIIYVVTGTIIVQEELSSFTLKENDIIYIASNHVHSFKISKDSHIISLQISAIWIHEIIPKFLSYDIFLCSSTLMSLSKKTNYQHFIREFLLLKDIFYSDNEVKEIGINGYIFLLIYLMATYFQVSSKEVNDYKFKYQPRIKKISRFVNNHYQEDIKLDDLADELTVSPQYLSKIFKKYYRISFKDYLTKIRLEHALYKMANSSLTLLEISQECGFPSQHAFIYTFKHYYQMTPSQYKKKFMI